MTKIGRSLTVLLPVAIMAVLTSPLPALAAAVMASADSGAPGKPAAGEPFEAFLDRVRTAPEEDRRALADSFMRTLPATPLIEDSTRVHFLYQGEARRVNVPGDFNSWDTNVFPMLRVDGSDLWYLSRTFEPDARLDYKFIIDGTRWILDPNNPLTCTGGFGPNSELRMPGYEPPPEIEEHPDIPHGTLQETSFHSVHLENRRTIQIYLPPGYATADGATEAGGEAGTATTGPAAGAAGRRYPMILFHDGLEYVSLAQADRVLDFLIHHGRIEPTLAVFVPPIDRRGEYVGARRAAFTRFIVEELIPWIDGHYRTDPRPARRAVMGASNGGDISLWLGVSHAKVFGHIGAQSTTIRDDVRERFRDGPPLDLILSLDLGTYDIPGIIPMVRGFIPVLEEKGYRFRYGEYPEGHSWGLWRAHLDDALELFFPVPEPSWQEAGSSQHAGGPADAGASGEAESSAGTGSPEDFRPPAGRIERLIEQLKSGTPKQKETALETFAREHPIEMVPAVIAALLDTTISPRHGDTGWGRIYHQAATALAEFAGTVDGLSLEERGRREYSFYDDVGTAPEGRRRQVHNRWLDWWRRVSAGMSQEGLLSPEPTPETTTFRIAPERLEALRAKADDIEVYLSRIERAVTTELPVDGTIPDMERTDWREQLRRQQTAPDFHGYSMELWRQANGGGLVERQVRCTILCYGQASLATVGPDLAIDLPARDQRLEWTVRTGRADLDEQIKQLVRERSIR